MKRVIQVRAAIRTWLWVVALVSLGAVSVMTAAETRPSVTPSSGGVLSADVSTNASYVIGANDLIRVEVHKEPDLTTETRVDQDGTVSLYLVKTVKVAGKSIAEAREVVRQLYEKDYLVAPHVIITLVQSSRTNKVAEVMKPKLKFTIFGEVKKPGVIEFPENEKVDLVRAIALAGDFDKLANRRNVTIKRVERGVEKVYEKDVQSMMRDANGKPFEVLPGDVIVVRQTIF